MLGAIVNQAQVLIYLNQVSVAEELLAEARETARELNDPAAQARVAWLFHLARARSQPSARSVAIASSVIEMWKGDASVFPLDGEGARDIVVPDPQRNGKIGDGPSQDECISPLDLPQAPNYLTFFEDRALAVVWALGQGDPQLAARLLGELQSVFAANKSALIRVRLQVLAGMVAYDQDNYPRAAAVLARACPELARLGLKPELWQVRRFLGWCAARLAWPAAEQEALIRQTQSLMTELAASLPPTQRAIYLLNKWTVEEMYLAAEIDHLLGAKAEVTQCPWYWRPWKRWQLWQRLDALLHRLDHSRRLLARRRVTGIDRRTFEDSAPRLWRRLWSHPWRRFTLSFLVLPDRVFMGRAGWFALDFAVAALSRLEVRRLVARWHECVRRGDRREVIDAVASELGAGLQLTQLLNALPRRTRRITIVPDDSLHGFPFAALQHKGRYLVEDYAISIAFDRYSRRTPPGRSHGEALAVAVTGGAGPSAEFPEGITPLPRTQDELDHVCRWFTAHGAACRCLIDGAADKATVLRQWAEARFVHIACHGLFQPKHPDASGLVLIPAPEQIEVLSMRELSRLDTAHLQHVTLSNCWSADNFVLPGRWIISLPETLWRSGACSVLSCLWAIDDDVGLAFSERFYYHLAMLPRDQALQATQLECLKNQLPLAARRQTADPFYWAGYQLYGESRRLRLRGRS